MIRKELIGDIYNYYDGNVLIRSLQWQYATFEQTILTKIDNKYIIMQQSNYTQIWHSLLRTHRSLVQPHIIFDFKLIYNCKSNLNNDELTINSDFDCICVGNVHTSLVNYAINKVRIEKLKTLI